MKLQILELSNKELVSYSGTIADEPEKLNIKLELLSARSTLSSLEKLSNIPNYDKIVQLTKISGIISLVSVLYSILIL